MTTIDVGLMDIAPIGDLVDIGAGRDGKPRQIEIFGISAQAFARLCRRYPIILDLLARRTQGVKFDAEGLIKNGPEAVSAVIAAACDKDGDAAFEAAIARHPLHRQLKLLEAAIAMTMPDGIGPFLVAFTRMVGTVMPADEAAVKAAAEAAMAAPSQEEWDMVNGKRPPNGQLEVWKGKDDQAGNSPAPSAD